MPIYVAADSADVWAQPHFFKTDAVGKPTCVAGCPPDEFSETGQLWAILSMTGKLWIRMVMLGGLNACVKASRFTTCAIDHFRGFESYWKYLLAQKHLLLVSGSKVQTTSSLQRLRKPWVI